MAIQPNCFAKDNYGSLVWWKSIETNKGNAKKLETIQRKAILLITGAMRTTPTESLQALLNITPIDITIKTTAAKAYLRLHGTGQWRYDLLMMKKSHRTIESYVNTTVLEGTDFIQKCFLTNPRFKVVINERNNWNFGLCRTEECRWYVDAHVNNTTASIGIYNELWEKFVPKCGFRVDNHSTPIQAELKAIEVCAEIINETDWHVGKSIVIISDCQAALKSIINQYSTTSSTLNCFETLNKLGKKCDLRIAWCPSHKGIKGNEKADTYAKTAGNKRKIDYTIKKSLSKCLEDIEKMDKNESILRWNERKKKLNFSNVSIMGFDEDDAKFLIKKTRLELRTIIGLKTGHAADHKYLTLIGKAEHSICRFCKAGIDSIAHFLLSCNALEKKKKRKT